MFIIEFYNYLRTPVPNLDIDQNLSLKQRISGIVNCYLTYLLLALCCFLIIKVIDIAIIKFFYNYSILSQFEINRQKLLSQFGIYTIIIIPFIGPLIEEILFRLPLNLRKTGIGLSLAVITYRITGEHFFQFDPSEALSYMRILIALFAFFFALLFTPMSLLEKIKKNHFKYFFYFSAISFALVHISNFTPYNPVVFLFYPLYTLPQFFMGLLLGYLRVRQGFFSGWTVHVLINLPSALLYYFK